MKKIIASISMMSMLLFSSVASAHLWQIGIDALGDGSLDFYGVSWHNNPTLPTVPGSVDDFVTRPAGLVINGTNVTFDANTVVDLEGCNGLAGISGTCSTIWNNLGLDVALQSTADPTGDIYGKYATVNLDPAELLALGITAGNNSITLTSFSDNVDWAARPFASGTAPIDIVVLPPTGQVPAPAGLALLAIGLFGMRLSQRKKA